MIGHGLRALAAAAILCATLADATAGDGQDQPEEDSDAWLSDALCRPYGPDYVLVPGTATCVKVDGRVEVDVHVRSGRR